MATVDIHYAKAILQCNLRRNLNVDQLMNEVGLNDALLAQTDTRIAGEKITHMIKHTWARLNDEFMGCTEHPCKHGVFALMCKYALGHDSLQQVLAKGIHFYSLFTDDLCMQLVTKAKTAELTIRFTKPKLDIDNFFQEFWLMIWHRFASWVIGKKIVLHQVAFPYPKPNHHSELKYAFPCRNVFEQNALKLSFSIDYLALAPVRTKRDLSIFLKNSPADFITIPGEEKSYQAKIRSLLIHQQQSILHCPSFEHLAAHFNVSSQTLRRKLKAEKTSYPQIKDEIRRDIAIQKLIANSVSITHIARSLGFSEPRSFTRAFKKWTGYNPSEYKESLG
jgi:AraC-like DNA-binding protein